jgi:mersacidin/lichenicidin family type 2 lantibiotic
MNIEEIIRSWKASEEREETTPSTNPVGEELSDQELQEATGGMPCTIDTCDFGITCAWTCFWTD